MSTDMPSKLHSGTVTVLTPVYNGEEYLEECIESVVKQSYQDWNYIILDNRSTDATLEIASRYARADNRISVVSSAHFLSMPGNFNRAFGLVPPESKYVKVVCADDWITPDCLEELVAFAESHPTVGIIGCHQQSGDMVRWRELASTISFLPGRAACRLVLLDGMQIFGAPTAFLYRAEMIREGPFFPNDSPHSDTSACFEKLDHWDFGVVHKILAVERVHDGQITTKISEVAAGDTAYLEAVKLYGPRYLDELEFSRRFAEVYSAYCRGLSRGVLNFKQRRFWDFQKRELAKLGLRLDYWLIIWGTISSISVNLTKPILGARKLKTVISNRLNR